MSKFQLILTGVFGFFIVLAVAVFALYRGSGSNSQASVTIWGDLPSEALVNVIDNKVSSLDKNLSISYVEKNRETIGKEFTEALASGAGPDLIIITQDELLENKPKLVPIPYESISQRDFQQTFIEEGELFFTAEGIYGLPLTVDPMVLYYNRDLLSAAGEAKPLSYWDEIYATATKLTQRDAAGNLTQSTIALGGVINIENYKDVLSLLFLQAGTSVVESMGGNLRSSLANNFDLTVMPAEAALEFYTQFSNPSKTYHSWNRSLPEAQTQFTSGDSAYYLGFASEYREIRNKNPNLNFDVAPVPQSRVAARTTTYGEVYALSITRGSRNPAAAMRAALLMISEDIAKPLSQSLGLPPVRRNLLTQKPSDSVMPVFYEAALQSRGWLDPDSEATRVIFRNMIESVTSGRARTQEAVNAAHRELDNLLN